MNQIKEILKSESKIKIIGTRHGEKLYETLLTKEEYIKSIDLEHYFKVPADNRDLNYDKYFEKGDLALSSEMEYNSHNTKRLSLNETIDKIKSLNII